MQLGAWDITHIGQEEECKLKMYDFIQNCIVIHGITKKRSFSLLTPAMNQRLFNQRTLYKIYLALS